jgi:short-subunit dehydrogenase
VKIERGMVAVITGASSGIGEATARLLADKGCRVILLARDKSRLDALAAVIQSSGGRADVYPVDLANARAIESIASAILAEVEIPDILINNAGAGR